MQQLEKNGSNARCWAHCYESGEDMYCWSGGNSWLDRAEATLTLAKYINHLTRKGWICHIIAHSHGGNIVNDALPELVGTVETVVTLGTPFIDVHTQLRKSRKQLNHLITLLSALFIIAIMLRVSSTYYDKYIAFAAFFVLFIAPLALLKILRSRQLLPPRVGAEPRKFAMGSLKDEVWQLLNHLQRIKNPFLHSRGLLAFIGDCLEDKAARLRKMSRCADGITTLSCLNRKN